MTRILIAGELNADLVMSGLPSLPILGRELVGDDFQIVMGSSSAITGARLARLGAIVDFVGTIGDDDLGKFVVTSLSEFGVNTDHIDLIGERTGVTIALTYAEDRALLTFPGTMTTYTGDNITSNLLANYSHIHVGSFFLQTALQPNLSRIFQSARQHGLTTSLDVGWDPNDQWADNPYLYKTLQHVDFFIPNDDETEAIIGKQKSYATLAERVAGMVIVKRGKQGAVGYNKDGKVAEVSSFKVDVIDTTGAGDAFNAGFIYAHKVKNLNIKQSMTFASACGAQAVTNIGGASNAPDAETIEEIIASSNMNE